MFERLELERRFKSFKARDDMIVGAKIGLVGVVFNVVFRLSQRTDWDRHPVLLVISVVGPFFAWIVWDAARRFVKAVWGVCRKGQFRNDSLATVLAVIYVSSFTCLGWYVNYIHSPHIHAKIVGYAIGEIREIEPTAAVTLLVDLSNSGVPSPITRWRLLLQLPNEETFTSDILLKDPTWFRGRSDIQTPPPGKPYNNYLCDETREHPIGATAVHGYIAFALVGYRREIVDSPTTTLVLIVTDKNGRDYEVQQDVEGKKSTFQER